MSLPTTSSGYTGLNIDGLASLQTGILNNISLAAARNLTYDEALNGLLVVTTGHASNAIVISTTDALKLLGKLYIIRNTDASLAATIKVGASTGIVVAATKTAIVMVNPAGTDLIRITADA